MEDFTAEEEEPWYDQQDLEQGERRGRESGVRPATPVRFSIVGRSHPGEDRAAPGVLDSEGRCVWRMRTWRDGGLPLEKRNQTGGDLQKSGERSSFPKQQGRTSPSSPTSS
ncbi:CDR2L [Cervus elaphus hippelaphus]|uniref:CDR2L n=1 Tax=Cervus elaphus hippelaphus TaxID=46360 RepID=A0A212DAF7_CEREH|nr:CDR2L [Cervus elaphus hippelaphus]